MTDKEIKKIAEKIALLERRIIEHKDVNKNQQKLEKIVSELSFEQFLTIDEYIMEQELVHKQEKKGD